MHKLGKYEKEQRQNVAACVRHEEAVLSQHMVFQ
jgi:hypothetical protein